MTKIAESGALLVTLGIWLLGLLAALLWSFRLKATDPSEHRRPIIAYLAVTGVAVAILGAVTLWRRRRNNNTESPAIKSPVMKSPATKSPAMKSPEAAAGGKNVTDGTDSVSPLDAFDDTFPDL